MRDLTTLDKYRDTSMRVVAYYGNIGDSTCGVFVVPSKSNGRDLYVIASSGSGWDHVSVSRPNRPPTWAEMDQIKRMFFEDDEVAMQLHVASKNHISVHHNCLHLWRPHADLIRIPPKEMVA